MRNSLASCSLRHQRPLGVIRPGHPRPSGQRLVVQGTPGICSTGGPFGDSSLTSMSRDPRVPFRRAVKADKLSPARGVLQIPAPVRILFVEV
jgi:hypothetical protein